MEREANAIMKAYNLETARQYPDRVTELYLHGLGMAEWPAVVLELPQLELLCLSENRLREIPESIGRLSRLRALDLSGNCLQSLPTALQNLKSLKELNLSGNEFSRFPAVLGKMTLLQRIDLEQNRLRSLPRHLANASGLISLRLGRNRIRELPEEWEHLVYLRELHLDQNQLSRLPEWVGNLPSLQVLSLAQNRLSDIPGQVGKLRDLRVLILERNKLRELPATLGGLKELTELNVRRNELESLPDSAGQLKGLRRLLLDDNRLSCLPQGLEKLHSLRLLSCQGNRLNAWPFSLGQLPRLETLELGNNQLGSLPDDPGKWPALERLGLQRNALSALPPSFCKFPRMKELDLGRNKFSAFPECLALAPSLEKVSGVSDASRAMRFIHACRHASVPEPCIKELFRLWQGKSETSGISNHTLRHGLRLPLPSLRKEIILHLLQGPLPPFEPRKSAVGLVGNTRLGRNEWKGKLEKVGLKYQEQHGKPPTHIVLGEGALDIPSAWFKKGVGFLDEAALFREVSDREQAYLQTIDDPGRLGRLLQSRQEASLRLALSLMKNGGVPPGLMTDLYLAWRTAPYAKLKKELKDLLLLHLSPGGKGFLEKTRYIRSEAQIANACKNTEFDSGQIWQWWLVASKS